MDAAQHTRRGLYLGQADGGELVEAELFVLIAHEHARGGQGGDGHAVAQEDDEVLGCVSVVFALGKLLHACLTLVSPERSL